MAGRGPYSPVSPPPRQQRSLSLLRAANMPEDETGGRWVNGFAWQPYPNTRGYTDDACGTNYPGGIKTTPGWYTNTAEQQYQPLVAEAIDKCTAFGWSAHDYEERARHLMEAITPVRVEREFWTGEMAQAEGYPNPYLTNTATVNNLSSTLGLPATISIRRAIAILEQLTANWGPGTRGLIHCEVQAAPALPTVRREGNLMMTAQDTMVVPGAGYPGTGPGGVAPAAGTTWLYATGMVDVRLDEIRLFPDPANYNSDDEFIGASIDRTTNEVIVRAERLFAATFDPNCHFAIQATLDT